MTERRVWIAQCLCPKRHAILAASGEADDEHEARREVGEPLRQAVEKLVSDGTINPWCGICSAEQSTWRYEVGRTGFRTAEEARPMLMRLQQENMRAAVVLGGHPGPGRTN